MAKRDRTRAQLLDVAWRLLSERGPAALRMEDVASEAGLTRQALYLHFKTRSALMTALVDYVDRTQGLGELIAPVFAERDPVKALRLFLHVNAVYAPRIATIARAIDIARETDEAMAAGWEDRMASRRSAIRGLLSRLELGDGWTLARATDAIWALGAPQVFASLVSDRGWSVAAFERFLCITSASFLAPATGRRLLADD